MAILHKTTVDIGSLRTIATVIHLTQYDNTMPEIQVTITKDGQAYSIPSDNSAEIRWGKPDNHGCTATGTIDGSTVTFAVTEQMCAVAGMCQVIVQLADTTGLAGTGAFQVMVEPNPINDSTIISDSEIADIEKAIEAGVTATTQAAIATEAAKSAEESLSEIGSSVETATQAAKSASASAKSASTSESNASASETNAKTSETNAKTSETNAATSESNAKTSETNAKASEDNSATSENNAAKSATSAAESATEAAKYKYTLPAATADTLGGIKVGENLSISDDGVLSSNATNLNLAVDDENRLCVVCDD